MRINLLIPIRRWVALLSFAGLLVTPGASAAEAKAARVVVIGVDGLGAQWIPQAAMPNLKRMMANGASSLTARGVMPTSSSPNWASMIMGAGPEQHGVTSNDWKTNNFEFTPTVKGEYGMFPTIFGQLRIQRPDSVIVCVHDWDDFARLFEQPMANLIEHVSPSPKASARAIEVIKEKKPTFTFIHFDDVDHAGHSKGWGSKEHIEAMAMVDGLIGDILKTLDQAGISKDTAVLVTADHGGTAAGKHGGNTMGELEIPWVLTGPGVAHGKTLQKPLNTFDTAPTIAYIFGLTPPECWIGKPVLEAFTQP